MVDSNNSGKEAKLLQLERSLTVHVKKHDIHTCTHTYTRTHAYAHARTHTHPYAGSIYAVNFTMKNLNV